jgi:apolipoprotein N-acyltransferase
LGSTAILHGMSTDQQELIEPRQQRWLLPLTDNLAVLAGLMMTTALPPFRGTGWLAPLALAVLWRVLLTAPRPMRTSWLFGLAHQLSLLYWLFFLEPAASIPTRWLVPVQAILAILYVSLFYLLFGGVIRLVRSRLGAAAALSLAPAAWVGMEAWRTAGELGFPWCLTGSAWLHTPLRPLLAVSGELGLAAATGLTAASLVALVTRQKGQDAVLPRGIWRPALLVITVLVWAGLALGAAWRSQTSLAPVDSDPRREPLIIAAVQADVSLDDKWRRARIDSTIVPYTELTAVAAARGAELVVWAETAVPAYVLLREPELLRWVRRLAQENGIHLYTGFPDAKLTSGGRLVKYNSSGLFGPQGDLLDQYEKHHLLPVGERMPFSDYLPFLANIDLGQAEWSPGEPPGPLVVTTRQGELRFAGLICFESIFADQARQAVLQGSQVLVNITNDGWFGQTAGPRQHAALARLRAVECGVPLVRCANNGISYIVDAKGKVQAWADLGRRVAIDAEVTPGRGDTLFVRTGWRPLAIVLLVWSLLVLFISRREGAV